MTAPIATVVRIAATPEQAKVFIALLRAEGIPAHADGQSLSDEFAMSQRLMNLGGTRVLVPTASLERAREILTTEAVDEAELEQQALAAAAPETLAQSVFAAGAPRSPNPLRWPLAISCALAIVFCVLWLEGAENRAPSPMTEFPFDWTDRTGRIVTTSFDDDENGITDRTVIRHDALVETWTDSDGDWQLDSCVVTDANGVVVQRLTWKPGAGFAIEKP